MSWVWRFDTQVGNEISKTITNIKSDDKNTEYNIIVIHSSLVKVATNCVPRRRKTLKSNLKLAVWKSKIAESMYNNWTLGGNPNDPENQLCVERKLKKKQFRQHIEGLA